ncbi:Dak1 domain-containing protein [Xylariales sp. PMI_506]|nr:Dak1 domain-containing protein [Xylariales sp. PMI_506]
MSLGKHFINGVSDPILRALRGKLYHDPQLRLIAQEKVIYRQPSPDAPNKVLIVAGGGSGHEPAYAGYLGEGMLDIAVAGNVFASPSASQIVAALRGVESPAGYLMVVKNYTGDKLNFGLAAEKAKASGKKVKVVFVGEDVSVEDNPLVGQRGLAGVVMVLKIAGAMAAAGASLDEMAEAAQRVADRMATAAVSLDRCSVPGRSQQESLPYEDIEYGMGIHNEPGVKRENLGSLEETVRKVTEMITSRRSTGWQPVPGQDVTLVVNNLGGLSVLEQDIVAEEVIRQLRQKGLKIARLMVGTFLTSLDGPGFSVTIMESDEQTCKLLDMATSAPAWPHQISKPAEAPDAQLVASISEPIDASHNTTTDNDGYAVARSVLTRIIDSINVATVEDEPLITKYDMIAGDGDCGETLLSGVKELKEVFAKTDYETMTLDKVFHLAATASENGMGGTSGAIYAIFLNAVSSSISDILSAGDENLNLNAPAILKRALGSALQELCRYTRAREGHRTLMDALIPFVGAFGAEGNDLKAAYECAKKGAEATGQMEAVMGRASYVSKDVLAEQGVVPDPGALGVVSVLRGICIGLDIDV